MGDQCYYTVQLDQALQGSASTRGYRQTSRNILRPEKRHRPEHLQSEVPQRQLRSRPVSRSGMRRLVEPSIGLALDRTEADRSTGRSSAPNASSTSQLERMKP